MISTSSNEEVKTYSYGKLTLSLTQAQCSIIEEFGSSADYDDPKYEEVIAQVYPQFRDYQKHQLKKIVKSLGLSRSGLSKLECIDLILWDAATSINWEI
ncbi:hypothetical protein LPW36_02110 [Jinshanibacter sp. LJY008]|uniref:Uncharacterized protein n=1 Tax=Limnobaculum eriocheiris TaxID=2897391 RepID=A0A9X1MTW0_9GAMM|nr:hypothetical protein [Limnobaculum eriocheiris]MCD1124839.1 hypothetical protein [Limnobaculum eriocheiris]